MALKSLADLPNEVIYRILQYLLPIDVSSLDLVSKRLHDLARQPVLWQDFCRKHFRSWDQRWNIDDKFRDNTATVDWKAIYAKRHQTDKSTSHQLDSLLSSQSGRIAKSETIVSFGYDAEDTLVRHLRTGDHAEDVLARRFHSKAVLGYLRHAAALKEWAKVRDGQCVPLDRALAAFDLFIMRDSIEDLDLDRVSNRLDHIAKQVREADLRLNDQSLRRRATAIAEFMRKNRFTGIDDEAHYHALPHNFIGIALQDAQHQCLPLITVAIYCSVAQRLGLDAQPCGFPFHVHAIIKAPRGQDLDGRHLTDQSVPQVMYMDPWNSSEETSQEGLLTQLKQMKVPPPQFSTLLGPSPVAEILRRTARNILTSVDVLSRSTGSAIATEQSLKFADGAFCGALWALLILAEDNDTQAGWQPDRLVSLMVQHLETRFHLDVPLFQEYVLPAIQDRRLYSNVNRAMLDIRGEDSKPKKPKYRKKGRHDTVHYKVGQVFRHKRYSYQAIITGWDEECEAGEPWITQMGVRNLPNGSHQAFYHAMVEDQSVRYVAEENIEITLTADINPTLMAIAGKHFKRWDGLSKSFVSNIRDEYPDD